MGAILSEAQIQSVDETAEFMRGVQVTELTGQSERIARLMVKAAEAEQRELKLASLLHEQQILSSAQDARIRQLEHEVKLLRGQVNPSGPLDDDEFTFSVEVGTATNHATVWISAINRKSDNWTFGGVNATAALINGVWVDIADIAEHLDPGALDDAAERLVAQRDEA